MQDFQFYQPIEVRYGDLDPQGHVNNSRYLTYMEQARIGYIRSLGLFSENSSFLEFGMILADIQVTFRSPIYFGQEIRVGAKVTQMGNKSLKMDYSIEDVKTGEALATGRSVLVAYDYSEGCSIPIPDHWRQTIAGFEAILLTT